MKKHNHALDALMISGIKATAILINILSAAILSRMISLESYGTYSTGNLIVSTAASITILGMMDASNYYYHQDQLNKKDCINTVGFLQILIGIACAVAIIMSGDLISAFFQNPMLNGIFVYIAFRPMLENLSNSLLSLQMAIGSTRAVGIQNALFAIGKLFSVLLTVFVTKNITTVFLAYLLMDAATVWYYYRNFKRAEFAINPFAYRKDLVLPVLRFAVPMGIYVMTNNLARDLDKLVIGYYESTAQLAIYSNCATLLPLGIVSSAFMTIIIPVMTRLVQQERYEPARALFRDYLSIGLISTSILAAACIILAEESILLLYGEKYLSGRPIFVLYILVDLIKFANITLVLAAKGKTKSLMNISMGMLVTNGILNLLFYQCMGVMGPALATVVTTLGMSIILLKKSGDILSVSLSKLFDWKKLGKFGVSLIATSVAALKLRQVLLRWNVGFFLRLLIVGSLFCCGMCLLNFRIIREVLGTINRGDQKA